MSSDGCRAAAAGTPYRSPTSTMLAMMMRSPPLKLRLARRATSSRLTMASTPDNEIMTPSSCSQLRRSRNSSQLAATMKAGATEPTTPMLSAVVKCSATNCSVPKAPPPTAASSSMRPALRLSLGQSAARCGSANGSTTSDDQNPAHHGKAGRRHMAARRPRDHVIAGPAGGRQGQAGSRLRPASGGRAPPVVFRGLRPEVARGDPLNCTRTGQRQACKPCNAG